MSSVNANICKKFSNMCINDEYDNTNPKKKVFIARHSFFGNTNLDCSNEIEQAKLFDGLTIFEAEPEIEVLFG